MDFHHYDFSKNKNASFMCFSCHMILLIFDFSACPDVESRF